MPKKQPLPIEILDSELPALPERVPVMPVKSTVIFPTGATGLQVSFPPNVEVLSLNSTQSLVVAIVSTEDEDSPIAPESLEKIAVIARVLNRLNLPGGTIQATIQGLLRVHLDSVRFDNGYYTAFPRLVEEVPAEDAQVEQLVERILTTLNGIGANVERLADVPRILRRNTGDPGRFADLVATLAHFNVQDKDAVLQHLDITERLRFVLHCLEREWERIRKSQGEDEAIGASESQRVSRATDRPSQLRKQIAAMQAELGELDPSEKEALTLLRRIDQVQLPARVASIARREAERLRTTSPSSVEATEIRNYLDVVLDLPWNRSDGGVIDLDAVEESLNDKHLGLEEAKRRILEILSVAMLRGNVSGLVPCIVGPPGVGKRSLAAAVARGLDRPMVRVELGGRGESQLIGYRRTRSGALPGKLISAYRDAGVRDPVLLLEEIDEVGLGNVEGDPVEAMEEFLDPDNRASFIDRYVDIPFDLSETILIATANDFFRVPRSLRDYLIEIRIAGYTPEEKVEIALKQMLPRLIREHGLELDAISVSEDTILFLTRGYARDAGLGSLRRALSAILRYMARETAAGTRTQFTLSREMIQEVLGIPRYPNTVAESAPEVGVVTGLAWTASGGELMFIEALKMPGSGRLITTGLLGEVMRESINAAYSYVRSRAEPLGIRQSVFPDHDLHIHFPAGATPKDGPSAGAAVTLAIASSLAERPVRHDVAMTGEVTLRGKVLEIGGVKEKILAAHRAGIREVILPTGNERDLRDVPQDVREGMTFHLVDHIDQVFDLALIRAAGARAGRRPRASTASSRGRRAAANRESAPEPQNKEGADEKASAPPPG